MGPDVDQEVLQLIDDAAALQDNGTVPPGWADQFLVAHFHMERAKKPFLDHIM